MQKCRAKGHRSYHWGALDHHVQQRKLPQQHKKYHFHQSISIWRSHGPEGSADPQMPEPSWRMKRPTALHCSLRPRIEPQLGVGGGGGLFFCYQKVSRSRHQAKNGENGEGWGGGSRPCHYLCSIAFSLVLGRRSEAKELQLLSIQIQGRALKETSLKPACCIGSPTFRISSIRKEPGWGSCFPFKEEYGIMLQLPQCRDWLQFSQIPASYGKGFLRSKAGFSASCLLITQSWDRVLGTVPSNVLWCRSKRVVSSGTATDVLLFSSSPLPWYTVPPSF